MFVIYCDQDCDLCCIVKPCIPTIKHHHTNPVYLTFMELELF